MRVRLARMLALGGCVTVGVACNALLGNHEGSLCDLDCGPDASAVTSLPGPIPTSCASGCSSDGGVANLGDTGSPDAGVATGSPEAGVATGSPEAGVAAGSPDAGADATSDAADANPPDADCGDGGVRNDPNNCGFCGNVCDGGVCTAGTCGGGLLLGSPTEYTGLKSLYGLVVLGDTLYGTDWYQGNTLVYSTSIRVPGMTPTLIVSKGQTDGSADALATDDTSLFYTIYRNDLSGNGPDVAGVWASDLTGNNAHRIAQQQLVDRIAVDGSYIYWSDYSETKIYYALKDGTGQGSLDVGATLRTPIAAKDGYVYFLKDGQLVRSPPALGAVVAVSDTSADVLTFAVDSLHAYWTDANARLNERRLDGLGIDGGGASVDVTPAGLNLTPSKGPVLFVDDGVMGSIYYAWNPIAEPVGGFSMLYRATKGSTAPATLLVSALAGFGTFAQDSQTIYFTTYGQDAPDADPAPPLGPPFSAVWQVAK